MKRLTNNTVLKQGNKSYPAIKTEQGIVWVDKDADVNKDNWWLETITNTIHKKASTILYKIGENAQKIIAANFELEGVPKIELEDEMYNKLCYYDKRNPDNCLTLLDKNEELGEQVQEIDYANKDCYCDNCFYGRTKLAEKIIANQAKYTEEDIRILANRVADFCKNNYSGEEYDQSFVTSYLQFLNSIKEITVDENFKIL